MVYKNFPLRNHKQANLAALYSLASGKQGKYIEMHKNIMNRFGELKKNQHLLLELASELGLNIDQLKADVKNPELQKQINTEVSELRSTGLRLAVPKFLINGEEIQLRALQKRIDEILSNSNGIN